MSTNADPDQEGGRRERSRARGSRGSWTVPVTAILIGGAYLAIYLGHHDVVMAVFGLLVMLGYAAILVFGSRRSEAVALLRGETGDERRRSIEQRAAALTLYVLAVVLVGGCLISLIRGRESSTWTSLCAVVGGTYLLSTIVLTRRS